MTVRPPNSRANGSNHSVLPPVTTFQTPTNKSSQPARGGGLRLGKVITDARAVMNPGQPSAGATKATLSPHASSMNGFFDGEERRLLEEMIEMLTTRLAKKEKETELLRLQQDAVETERSQRETTVAILERNLRTTALELTAKGDVLQRELQQAQLQADRFRADAESQRVTSHEMRRQRERDVEVSLAKEQRLERQVFELERELAITQAERQSLTDQLLSTQHEQNELKDRLGQAEINCARLEETQSSGHAKINELTLRLEESQALTAMQNERLQKMIQDKRAIEDKAQQLARNLRDVSIRAGETDRRMADLSKAESNVTKQLTQLHHENEELKSRNGHLQTQSKQQQNRIAGLEREKSASEAERIDAAEGIEQAKKQCREYQFRIKQLQEEAMFLSKKKPAAGSRSHPPAFSPELSTQMEMRGTASDATVATNPALPPYSGPDDGVPSWMRE